MRLHRAVAAAALAALAIPAAASAHAVVSPVVVEAKQLQFFTLSVPTEKENATTTSIELTPRCQLDRRRRGVLLLGRHREGEELQLLRLDDDRADDGVRRGSCRNRKRRKRGRGDRTVQSHLFVLSSGGGACRLDSPGQDDRR